MSSQWGHGFHKGAEAGLDRGVSVGEVIGSFSIGEHSWHCVNAAIDALERNEEMQALGVLRTMRYMLAHATGRDVPANKTNNIKTTQKETA